MRFMIMRKSDQKAKAGALPSPQFMTEMQKFNKALQDAGVWVSAEGLHPTSKGALVKVSKKAKPIVIDGPFAESKEVVAGFWIWNVKSKEEAIEWASRCPASDNDVIELRQVMEFADFTPDVKEAASGFAEMQAQVGPGGRV